MCAVGGPMGASVVLSQPLCLRGLDLHLSLQGLGFIHFPPAGPLEEATLGVEEEEEGAWRGVSQRLDYCLNTDVIHQSDEWVNSYHIIQKRLLVSKKKNMGRFRHVQECNQCSNAW